MWYYGYQRSFILVLCCNSSLLWPSFRNHHMRSRVSCLSIPSVPTLCLKNTRIGNDTINPELLLPAGMIRWNKLPRYWQLKDKKNSPLTINNHLLEHNDVTIICPICLLKLSLYYPDMLFIVLQISKHKTETDTERERERACQGR